MKKLFRHEVIEKQSSRQLGDIFIPTPMGAAAITLLIAIIILGLASLLILGKYTRKERVGGVLVPNQGLVQVFPSQSGNFKNIYVQTGDRIEREAPLFEVSESKASTSGDLLSATLLSKMKANRDSLATRLKGVPSQFALKKKMLNAQKNEFIEEERRAVEQRAINEKLVSIEKSLLDKMRALERDQAASLLEVKSAENRFLLASQSLNATLNSGEKLLSEVKKIDLQLEMLPFEQAEMTSNILDQMNKLDQDVIRTEIVGNSIFQSPVSGTIAAVIARKGQRADAANMAISILPEGSELQAELYIPTTAIAFIKTGQPVRLLYDAFPYQKFGYHEGVITDISRTVLLSTDMSFAPTLSEPVFLVTVDIESQSIHAQGKDFNLQSGMTLYADIVLEDRKVWEWVFEPILGKFK